MRYSLEPSYRRYVQGQGFMSFAKNIGNKYGRKIFDKSIDEIWFTDQNNNALEIEDNVNISLIINTS